MPWLPPVILDSSTAGGRAIVWSLVLAGLVLAMFLVANAVRRWFTKPDAPPEGGFSLSDLRQLHKEGKLSVQEYEKAKALIVAKAQAALRRQEEEKARRDQSR